MNKPIHESKTRTIRGLKELLPERWKLIKLKLVCNIETGFAFPSEVFGETGTPVIRITDIKDREINLSEIKRVDDLLLKSKPKRPSVNKGDIIMAMTGATIGKVGYYNSDKPSYLNQRVCRFIPASIDRGYLWHTLNSEIYKKYIELEAFGGAQANISDSQLLNFPAPLPELEAEQQKIAQFLDYETAKIDALIDEQKRLIELLKEKRQAVISHAVTKGLNPDAPMKDSGVEWLGEVPEHWELRKVKLLFRLKAEPAPPDNDHELLSVYTDIGVKPRKELEQKGNKASTTDGYWMVKKGDLIVNKLLAWMGAVGMSDYDGVTSPAYDVLEQIETLEPYFYHLLFRNKQTQNEFKRWSRGIMEMRLRLYFEQLGQIYVPFPPLKEQREIVQRIKMTESTYSALTIEAEKQVKLLTERRSALISAAVTGKIDVRDWQPPAGSDTVDSNALVHTERHYG